MDFFRQLDIVTYILKVIKMFFFIYGNYYIVLRITNKNNTRVIQLIATLIIAIIAIVYVIINSNTNFFYSTIFLIFILAIMITKIIKEDLSYSVIINVISLSINYIIFFISTIISFIPKYVLKLDNEILELVLLIIMYLGLVYQFLKIRKIKKGFIFLKEKTRDEYFNILILNISMIVLFGTIILSNYRENFTVNFMLGFVIFSIVMFVTIQKSLQLYYKQKLLIQELNETKEELENKKKEVEELEKENLNFSKTSHTLAHKQRALEYKINQLILKNEIAEEIEIKDSLENISKEMYKTTATIELDKTGIPQIDNMLEYMQSECIKNEIEFELQIIGNIHSMTNNLISKEDLETLIADHIKNAIIAINHTDNLNKSILVKLGKIDGTYSLYIYDSGIEFQKETLENLGKKPSTTHSEEGGTGMGFMNTFDTLKKYKASLTINELNPPNRENYTKVLIIKFDKKEEFKIISYREEKEIKLLTPKDTIVEKEKENK